MREITATVESLVENDEIKYGGQWRPIRSNVEANLLEVEDGSLNIRSSGMFQIITLGDPYRTPREDKDRKVLAIRVGTTIEAHLHDPK